MNPEEQDQLWELLGKARRQEPGTFFARNVARQARLLASSPRKQPTTVVSKLLDWLQATPLALPVGAVALAAFGLFLNFSPPASNSLVTVPTSSAPSATEMTSAPTEIAEFAEELNELDEINELVALQDVSSIDDAAIALLLF